MKKLLFAALEICLVETIQALSPYVSMPDPNHPEQHMFNGIITKYALINDSTYKWYRSSQSSYTPSAENKLAMEQAKNNNIQFLVFGCTWFEDTQFVLPKFFKWQEQAGFPDAGISMFAVDRNKKTIGGITDGLGITNVPTIIVMKNGKEVGRVIEYGKTGQWDKELAELLK